MADSITDNDDLLTGLYPLPENEWGRLTRDLDGQDTVIHNAAWTRILADLSLSGIEESDLNDSSQFTSAAVYYCLYLLYSRAGREQEKAQMFYGQYERTFGAITPDVGIAETAPLGSMLVRVSRG